MCGICGKWSLQGVDQELLSEMAGAIRHRGPDDEGFYINGNIGLANRRLSILDLHTGKQPISNEDSTVWVVFNGEIYNHRSLRDDLLRSGHQFKTQTDTEVIVHLYEEEGERLVEKLSGMFAFALWDEKRQRLLLARDRLGQKPLYTAEGPHFFSFASEVKSLLKDPDVRPRLNPRAMHNYISLRCIPGTETLFEGIKKVPAGHTLLLENGRPALRKYWELRYTQKLKLSERETIEQLKRLLIETVRSHMISDVPLGAFLSGGIDSSAIASIMAFISDRPIKTFSIGVDEQDFNELPYARLVAKRWRTEHHEMVVKPNLIEVLPEMIYHLDEPSDPFAFGVYSVAKITRPHVKVVLGGDGGDEMFAGYDRYLGNKIIAYYCLIPRFLRKTVFKQIINHFPDSYSYNSLAQKLRWLDAMSEKQAGARYAESLSFLRFGHEAKRELYTDELWREVGGADSTECLTQFMECDNARDLVDRMLYTDVMTRLPEHLLMIVDRMTMAHSIEGRSPYLDERVAEFAASIPANLKLKGGKLKYILKAVARDFLPPELLRRRKQGFSFPLAYWFRNELKQLTEEILLSSSMIDRGYFKRGASARMLEEHVGGRIDHNYRIWVLLNLELWHRMFIEGEKIERVQELVAERAPVAA